MPTPLRKFTDELKAQIKLYNKKRIDLKDLIAGYDISNEDLSGSFISHLDMSDRNISNCNLSRSTVKLILLKGIAQNCNFFKTQFLEGSTSRGADLRYSNLSGANATHVDLSYAKLEGCSLCDITFTMFSKRTYKASFSKDILELIKENLIIEGLNTE